ncbi:MAG: hypothetical protein WCY92_12550 [Novosphingobium sp.]
MRADPNDTPPFPRRSARAPTQRLREAIAALAGPGGEILDHAESSWASITFSGTRHRLNLRFSGMEGIEAGESFIEALPEHEFAIPRQLVADASIGSVEHRLLPHPRLDVSVELLLLEEN